MQAPAARVAFSKSIYREYVDRADRYVSRLTRESNLVGGFHVQITTTGTGESLRNLVVYLAACDAVPKCKARVNVAWMRSSLSVALGDYLLSAPRLRAR